MKMFLNTTTFNNVSKKKWKRSFCGFQITIQNLLKEFIGRKSVQVEVKFTKMVFEITHTYWMLFFCNCKFCRVLCVTDFSNVTITVFAIFSKRRLFYSNTKLSWNISLKAWQFIFLKWLVACPNSLLEEIQSAVTEPNLSMKMLIFS